MSIKSKRNFPFGKK